MAHSPNLAHCQFLQIKFYYKIVSLYFHSLMCGPWLLSRCNKDRMAQKPKILIICSLQQSWLAPDLQFLMVVSSIFTRKSLAVSLYGNMLPSELASSPLVDLFLSVKNLAHYHFSS